MSETQKDGVRLLVICEDLKQIADKLDAIWNRQKDGHVLDRIAWAIDCVKDAEQATKSIGHTLANEYAVQR